MRIEDITIEDLERTIKRTDNVSIRKLRMRFVQLYEKFFENNEARKVIMKSGHQETVLTRGDLIEKYSLVLREIRKRKLDVGSKAIDTEVMKSSIWGFSIASLPDAIVIPGFISVGGDYIKSPKSAESVDIIIKASEEGKSEELETKLMEIVKLRMGKEPNFIYSPEGPKGDHIPLFNLMIQAEAEMKKVKSEEGEEFDIKKPYPNEHSCRLKAPGGFKPESFRRIERTTDGKKYNIVMGRLKGETTMTEQAYRYPKDTWTESSARTHCKAHDGILFEPAMKKSGKPIDISIEKLSLAQQKECDEETEKIKENKKLPLANKPHEFKAAKYTHPNGHPRCLICGDEEPIGKVCNMSEAWYQKYDWDDEEAWTDERKKLKVSGKLKKALGEGQGVGGDRQGVGGTDICVCPKCGHEEKHERNVPCAEMKCPKCGTKMIGKEEKQKSALFKIMKIDKKQHIVGGIVYEPDVVDSQGDMASKEEIEKAMYRFMEKYATQSNRIRIMHKGKMYYFPIMESFIPESDMTKGGQTVKAGSWWLMVKVLNKQIWDQIESGKLTGFSMGGRAKA